MNGVNDYFAWKMAFEQATVIGLFIGFLVVILAAGVDAAFTRMRTAGINAGFLLHKKAQYDHEKCDYVWQLWVKRADGWVFYKNWDDATRWERMRAI